MTKKYELTDDVLYQWGRELYRIRALVDIPMARVKAGDLGGYVESEDNLDQSSGKAWLSYGAQAFDNARVCGDAQVEHRARIFGNAQIDGHARVVDDAWVYGDAVINSSRIADNAQVFGKAHICCDAIITNDARVCGLTFMGGPTRIAANALVERDNHFFTINPVMPWEGLFTFYRGRDGAYVYCSFFKGPLAEFEEAAERECGDRECSQEFRPLGELAKMRAAEWEGK